MKQPSAAADQPLSPSDQDDLARSNREVFERPGVVEAYIQDTALRSAEQTILDRYRAGYLGKRVLDLGVGAGRTAAALAPHAALYVGIDFSQRMVAVCRERFPQWSFEWGDARDLARFESGSFDFVLFSFNGLDYVEHQDRRRVLAEVQRVLADGGVFAFSSHNLDATSLHSTGLWSVVLRRRSPLDFLRAIVRASGSLRGRLRNRGKQIRTDSYAILNDPAHQFGLRTYYIGPDAQIAQLRHSGFNGPAEVFGDDGLPLSSAVDKRFLHYVVRKRG